MMIMMKTIVSVKWVPRMVTTTIIIMDAAIVESVIVAAIITMSPNPRKRLHK